MEGTLHLVQFGAMLGPPENKGSSLGLMIRIKGQNKCMEHILMINYEGKCKRKCPNRNLFPVVNPREFPGTNWSSALARRECKIVHQLRRIEWKNLGVRFGTIAV